MKDQTKKGLKNFLQQKDEVKIEKNKKTTKIESKAKVIDKPLILEDGRQLLT